MFIVVFDEFLTLHRTICITFLTMSDLLRRSVCSISNDTYVFFKIPRTPSWEKKLLRTKFTICMVFSHEFMTHFKGVLIFLYLAIIINSCYNIINSN